MMIFLVSIGLIIIEATGVWLTWKHKSLMYIFNAGLVYIWCPILLIISCCVNFCVFVSVTHRSEEELSETFNYRVNQVLFLASIFALHLCGTIIGAIIGSGLATLGQGVFGIISVEERIYSTQNWKHIKEHLYNDSEVCAQLEHKFGDDSVDSGCCKPPKGCNFNYSRPPTWMKIENQTHTNKDCEKWDNDPKKLCYDCQACKHGYSQELKKAWTISGAIVLVACTMLVPGLILSDKELARC
ncbi:Tetraspanin-8 [Bienertia sinuspersici]